MAAVKLSKRNTSPEKIQRDMKLRSALCSWANCGWTDTVVGGHFLQDFRDAGGASFGHLQLLQELADALEQPTTSHTPLTKADSDWALAMGLDGLPDGLFLGCGMIQAV